MAGKDPRLRFRYNVFRWVFIQDAPSVKAFSKGNFTSMSVQAHGVLLI